MVDFDSTVWPTRTMWADITGNPRFNEDHSDWYGPVAMAGGPKKFDRLLETCSTYETMSRFQPFPGAIETLVELQELGAHQTLLTARREHELDAVSRVLADHGYRPEVAASRRSLEKIPYALEHRSDLMLEDEPRAIAAAHAAGLSITSLRYGYNADVIDRLSIPYASDWTEWRPIIFKLLGLRP
jgi:phosphoglycolate phosphatase-like HAD superfamily hydrolase